MILEIQTGTDNPILRKKSTAISKFDKKLKKFVKDMTETMLKKDGLGLAAPQVGVNERLVIVNFRLDSKNFRPTAFLNPEIIEKSLTTESIEEGCLSLPGIFGKVSRPVQISLKFCDENGANRILALDGINARAAQHEIDHLDGILFVDKVEGEMRKEK
ncbi:peptide deformylase [Candidatus Gracilibacteria bacterium]|nr:peptide deformylase [Candidatus Gracilibacteria bacterium]MCF7856033.1 peptide deformylase [Candidatus Gracilibacteria bacterium]MCF7896412.1 peptide deformylase [Candidatus Gracilibacteria bacterium]